ncbi:MAG: thioredoxin family protein [Candidatus Dependentiae bacterium]|nr:thioredoxin family protein [Candidatus Dependentiae bacterium]
MKKLHALALATTILPIILITQAGFTCSSNKPAEEQTPQQKSVESQSPQKSSSETTSKTGGSVYSLTPGDDFDQLIKQGNVVVDFYGTWCPPCQRLAPILNQLAQEYSHITFIKVDTDKFEDLSSKYNIRSLPTLIFFKDGKKIQQGGSQTDKNAYKKTLDAFYPQQ